MLKNNICFILLFAAVILHAPCLLAQYVVTSANDPVNPFATVNGELRYAMEQANLSVTPVTITFNIPGPAPHIINLHSSLPMINNIHPVSISIDGTSQPGYAPGNPAIIIDGNNSVFNPVGIFYVYEFNFFIKGLYIRNFTGEGIEVVYTNNSEISHNVINRIANTHVMTADIIIPSFVSNTTIKTNILGTDATLTNFSTLSAYGVDIGVVCDNDFIGTGVSGDANTIAYHTQVGVFNGGEGGISHYNLISQNIIFNNPLAITLYPFFNANDNIPAPVINPISALSNVTGTAQPHNKIELFGGTAPQNANQYFTTVTADGSGNWSANMSASTYAYVTATATDKKNNTSMLNDAPVPPQTLPCTDCIGSFAPDGGKSYLISAWVKEDNAPVNRLSYTHPKIFIDFIDGFGHPISTVGPFVASGLIIDGWQRIEKTYLEPANTADLKIRLVSDTADCNFDDIRVYPFDGEMKTFVYDPHTLRLVSELDEQNYATIYEYDEEGKLVRVKKETERGVMTIKEVRTHVQKQ